MSDKKYGRIFTEQDVRNILDEVGVVPSAQDDLIQTSASTFLEDEPVFVLRGQDRLAPLAIQEYANLRLRYSIPEESHEHFDGVVEAYREMRIWQLEVGPDRTKLPD